MARHLVVALSLSVHLGSLVVLGQITCPGFPGFCSESFPGQTCVVVCDRGRNNVPLCQEDGTWTDIPRCIEHEPGTEEQIPGLCPGVAGYCSEGYLNQRCRFPCAVGRSIDSVCTADGTWLPYPTCVNDVRETQDGCNPCPGPPGRPRNRPLESILGLAAKTAKAPAPQAPALSPDRASRPTFAGQQSFGVLPSGSQTKIQPKQPQTLSRPQVLRQPPQTQVQPQVQSQPQQRQQPPVFQQPQPQQRQQPPVFHEPQRQQSPVFHEPQRQQTPVFHEPQRQQTPVFHEPQRQQTPVFQQPQRQQPPVFQQPQRQQAPVFQQPQTQQRIQPQAQFPQPQQSQLFQPVQPRQQPAASGRPSLAGGFANFVNQLKAARGGQAPAAPAAQPQQPQRQPSLRQPQPQAQASFRQPPSQSQPSFRQQPQPQQQPAIRQPPQPQQNLIFSGQQQQQQQQQPKSFVQPREPQAPAAQTRRVFNPQTGRHEEIPVAPAAPAAPVAGGQPEQIPLSRGKFTVGSDGRISARERPSNKILIQNSIPPAAQQNPLRPDGNFGPFEVLDLAGENRQRQQQEGLPVFEAIPGGRRQQLQGQQQDQFGPFQVVDLQ